jgi:anti-sigma regulatory factor (Ser/Thr protein kinase)
MSLHRILFPKQPTISYVDSFLKAVREVIQVTDSRVILDLSQTTEVSTAVICFLCGLIDLSYGKRNQISLVLPRNKRASRAILAVKELTRGPGRPAIRIASRMCQARKITGNNSAYIEEMLALLSEHLKISQSAFESLRVVLTELLTNAIDHSGERSCYICAGAWGRSRFFHLTLLDFGVGIPQKIRTRYSEYEDDQLAVRALLTKGLTTRVGLEGGKGYKFIQEILKRNKGRLHIFSGRAKIVLKYDKGEYHYKKARKGFTGTCVDIQFDLEEGGLDSLAKESITKDFFL